MDFRNHGHGFLGIKDTGWKNRAYMYMSDYKNLTIAPNKNEHFKWRKRLTIVKTL